MQQQSINNATLAKYNDLTLNPIKSKEEELTIVTSDSELIVMMPMDTSICTGMPNKANVNTVNIVNKRVAVIGLRRIGIKHLRMKERGGKTMAMGVIGNTAAECGESQAAAPSIRRQTKARRWRRSGSPQLRITAHSRRQLPGALAVDLITTD